MITLELSDEEALNLRNLLDVAVRAGGMRAAELAVVIDKKVIEAAKTISTPLRRTDGTGRLPDEYLQGTSVMTR